MAAFVASRVAKTRDSKGEPSDRAVLRLIENRVLLPGITTVSRLVTEVRREGLTAINQALVDAAPRHMRGELVATLAVPAGKKVSVLEWMRTAVTKLSGTGMCEGQGEAAEPAPAAGGGGPAGGRVGDRARSSAGPCRRRRGSEGHHGERGGGRGGAGGRSCWTRWSTPR
ncbi:hypothetical protein AB0J63_20280 [Streptosporangium canum]|uniref:hypothetical protein n=1 Tax=Streptosporangium canum TaxID=324952 RepID=UPI0034391F2E